MFNYDHNQQIRSDTNNAIRRGQVLLDEITEFKLNKHSPFKNRILVVINGHGEPNYEVKKNACQHNLDLIIKTAPEFNVDIEIFSYDSSPVFNDYSRFNNVTVTNSVGFGGQHIFNHLTPEKINDYEKLIIFQDDIFLPDNFNLSYFLGLQSKYNIDILSPSLSPCSKVNHRRNLYRSEFENTIRIVKILEFFFYVFSKGENGHETYEDYYSLFSSGTRSMWGLDCALYHCLDFRLGIVNDCQMRHLFGGNSRTEESEREWANLNHFLHKTGRKPNIIPKDLTNPNFNSEISTINLI